MVALPANRIGSENRPMNFEFLGQRQSRIAAKPQERVDERPPAQFGIEVFRAGAAPDSEIFPCFGNSGHGNNVIFVPLMAR